MDSLTQAVLGAAVQGAGMGRYQGKRALLYGAMLGTLPDLDILLSYADPISSMTYHRGATHSLFVLPLLAAVMAVLIKKIWRNTAYSYMRLFLTLCLALVTHPLLDAFTVYGTQLFWPLDVTPQQWAGVAIIDPLYTLPLLLACGYALKKKMDTASRRALTAALLWGCVYLAWGTYGQYHHEMRVRNALAAQGIHVGRIMATPTAANTLLFRVIAETDNGEYIDAVSGWADRAPPEFVRLPQGREYGNIAQQNALYRRLHWFADGWLRLDIEKGSLIATDLRMGLAGKHHFRFVVAEESADGWQPVLPYEFPVKNLDYAHIGKLLTARMAGNPPALPLAAWTQTPPLSGSLKKTAEQP